MHTTNLRKVGGSTMLAVPPALLEILHLEPGATVAIAVEGNRLVIERPARPRYSLQELLARCDATAAPNEEDLAWAGSGPVGGELI
jgi:antitoxin ChpS